MRKVKDRRLRKTLVLIVACITMAVGFSLLLSFHMVNYIEEKQLQQNAQMVGLIAEKYPLSQSEIIEIMQNDQVEFSEYGEEILKKYGMDYKDDSLIGPYQEIFYFISSNMIALIFIFCSCVFFIFYFYLKNLTAAL